MISKKPLIILQQNIAKANIRGFTLIEVMVALAIIAIALASLIKASGGHTNSAAYLKSKTLAHYVAINEVTQLQIEKAWPSLGSKHKSTEMAGVEWYWTREIEKADDPTGTVRVLKITVYQDEDRSHNLAHVNAYMINPGKIQPPTGTAGQSGINPGGAGN